MLALSSSTVAQMSQKVKDEGIGGVRVAMDKV